MLLHLRHQVLISPQCRHIGIGDRAIYAIPRPRSVPKNTLMRWKHVNILSNRISRDLPSSSAGRASACSKSAAASVPMPQPISSTRLHARSEEHTSELQSHLNLVCRLLLEKK